MNLHKFVKFIRFVDYKAIVIVAKPFPERKRCSGKHGSPSL
jgi:hypothetical protein